jgi:hypothetical protein
MIEPPAIVFNHATESIGMSQVGLPIDKADIRSMHFLDESRASRDVDQSPSAH